MAAASGVVLSASALKHFKGTMLLSEKWDQAIAQALGGFQITEIDTPKQRALTEILLRRIQEKLNATESAGQRQEEIGKLLAAADKSQAHVEAIDQEIAALLELLRV